MRQRRWGRRGGGVALWVMVALCFLGSGPAEAGAEGVWETGKATAALSVSPLLDVPNHIYGVEVGWEGGKASLLAGRPWSLRTGVGYSFPQKEVDGYAGLELAASSHDRFFLSWRRWAGSPVLGRKGEEGVSLNWRGQRGLERRLNLDLFQGRLYPLDGEGAPPEVLYLSASLSDYWLVGPARVGAVAQSTAGRVLPAGGDFYGSLFSLSVEVAGLKVRPFLGFSSGVTALAEHLFSLGGVTGSTPLHGYAPKTFQGDRVAGLNLEYRRPLPWLSETGLPVLSWLEGVVFADAADTLAPGEAVGELDLHLGYGAGLALYLGAVDLRWDLAWSEEGDFQPEVYLAAAF